MLGVLTQLCYVAVQELGNARSIYVYTTDGLVRITVSERLMDYYKSKGLSIDTLKQQTGLFRDLLTKFKSDLNWRLTYVQVLKDRDEVFRDGAGFMRYFELEGKDEAGERYGIVINSCSKTTTFTLLFLMAYALGLQNSKFMSAMFEHFCARRVRVGRITAGV